MANLQHQQASGEQSHHGKRAEYREDSQNVPSKVYRAPLGRVRGSLSFSKFVWLVHVRA